MLGVIILAAGKGTRMKSEKPKVCFELAGKSLIQRVVNTSLKLNADLIGIVVGFKKYLVMQSIANHPNIRYIDQETQNGTGDAVKCAKECFQDFKGTIFVLCGDVPLLKAETLQQMLNTHTKAQAKCTVLTMFLDNPDKYGRMVRDKKGVVKEIVEFRDAGEEIRKIKEINTGIYCFDSAALFDALEKIDNNNDQKEYYLTDVLKIMYESKLGIESVVLKDISEAAGINSQAQLADLEKEHYRAINTHWLNNGVSIENPDTVLIHEDVIIENDVYISANTAIKGQSHIKKDSYIGPNCVIIDSVLEAGSHLEGFNVVINGEGAMKLGWSEKST
jgi:UDP-N-acetylglucosamine diphosphorylase/glucosamine-1-phosphate N-acetyltransferase